MSQPNQRNGQTVESFRIVGIASHVESLKKLAKSNPDWKLSPDEIVDNGKTGQKIYRLRFVSKPVELRTDSDAVTVIVAGREIGYIRPEDTAHVKDILDNYDVQGLACGIRGGQYKIVDAFYDVTTQQQGIAATVRIVYSNMSFPFDGGVPKKSAKKTEKPSKKKKAKKPLFKRWWSWVIVALVALITIGSTGEPTTETAQTEPIVTTVAVIDTAETASTAPETVAPTTVLEMSIPITEAPTTVPYTEYPIEAVTEQSLEPATEPEVIVPPTTQPKEPQEVLVWIPTNGGRKYHSRSSCSNMINPEQVTISQAIARGFEPCKRCY